MPPQPLGAGMPLSAPDGLAPSAADPSAADPDPMTAEATVVDAAPGDGLKDGDLLSLADLEAAAQLQMGRRDLSLSHEELLVRARRHHAASPRY